MDVAIEMTFCEPLVAVLAVVVAMGKSAFVRLLYNDEPAVYDGGDDDGDGGDR